MSLFMAAGCMGALGYPWLPVPQDPAPAVTDRRSSPRGSAQTEKSRRREREEGEKGGDGTMQKQHKGLAGNSVEARGTSKPWGSSSSPSSDGAASVSLGPLVSRMPLLGAPSVPCLRARV